MTTTQNTRTHPRHWLGLALGAFTLGGCSVQSSDIVQDFNPLTVGQWRQIDSAPNNAVELVTLEHVVAYAPNAIRLGDPERGRMIGFVQDNRITGLDLVLLSAPRSADGTQDPVTSARLEVLEGELLTLGLPVEFARHSTSGAVRGGDQVAIVIERAVAIPPDCTAPQPWPGNRPDWQPGCATNAAMSYMIANPRDLAVGRDLAPAEGNLAGRAVRVYHHPKMKAKKPPKLVGESTTGGK